MATTLNEPPVKDNYLDPNSVTHQIHAEAKELIRPAPHGCIICSSLIPSMPAVVPGIA